MVTLTPQKPKPIEMKRTLLATGLVLSTLCGSAQITTYVLQPPALEGALEFTWADAWGLTPDLNDPANAIQQFAVYGYDGTAGDSLGCEAFINSAEVAGKIAVVYRGTCEFGMKALNAQNAGAIGCVIVNNAPGAPIAMGAGAVGAQDTIPIVMITFEAGAAIRSEVLAGNVEMYIGSVLDVFEYNLSTQKGDVLMAKSAGVPRWVATDASELSVDLGGWIHNFGSLDQSDVSLSATINVGGTEVYNEQSAQQAIASGDSLFFGLPAFTQSSYAGLYEVSYTINSGATEEFPSDNIFNTNFLVDSLYTFSKINTTTFVPNQDAFYQPSGTVGNFMSCVNFRDANGSRIRAEGMWTAATHRAPGTMDGQVLEARMIQWSDDFTGIANATFTSVPVVQTGEYFYESDLSQVLVYIPFAEPVALEDNQRYLFCVWTPSDSVFIGHNSTLDYNENDLLYDEPTTVISDNDTWYPAGFGSDVPTGIAVKFGSVADGIGELGRVDITPYPNPTANTLRIPLKGQSGAAMLRVFDLSGAKVMETRTSIGGDHILTVDLATLANGMYMFHMDFDNGQRSDFRVVVKK